MRRRFELMQLEIGISTNRYFPASGTAGLERSLVSGNRRLPCPPPIMTESTLPTVGAIRLLCILSTLSVLLLYNPFDVPWASGDGEALLRARGPSGLPPSRRNPKLGAFASTESRLYEASAAILTKNPR